jgi:hypothetical protein
MGKCVEGLPEQFTPGPTAAAFRCALATLQRASSSERASLSLAAPRRVFSCSAAVMRASPASMRRRCSPVPGLGTRSRGGSTGKWQHLRRVQMG